MLAKAYIQEGMHEKAVGEYQKVLKRKPDDVTALAELAKIYLDQKKYNDAVAQYKKILKNEARRCGGIREYGLCLQRSWKLGDGESGLPGIAEAGSG